MALCERYLVIKKSTIPGAGKCLFTKEFIAKGTRIVEYKGIKTTWKEVLLQQDVNGIVYYVKSSLVIDAKNSVKTFGRFANDARGIFKLKTLKNNSSYVIDGDRVFIEAIKDIAAGDEILVSYGREYWDVVRYNKRNGL